MMEFHLPETHYFADDSQLYVLFQPNENANESAAITAMQNCIDDVKKWMFANKLKRNDGKTEFLLIGTRQQLAKVHSRTLRVGEITVTCSSVLKSLGCWFDSQLKFETHN